MNHEVRPIDTATIQSYMTFFCQFFGHHTIAGKAEEPK